VRKMQEFIVKGNRIFIGLEDSKKTWKVCVRSKGVVVHEASMPAKYDVLKSYLLKGYPECRIRIMYEAGFQGFWLHDLLEKDGFECVVTPPNKVSCPKSDRVKTDRRDARLLAKNLEIGLYVSCHVPDRELREDRQISRTLEQVKKKIKAQKNQIRKMFDYHGLNDRLPEKKTWTDRDYLFLRTMELPYSLKVSLDVDLTILETLFAVRKDLLEKLRALCPKERYKAGVQAKRSIPGIGVETAIRLTLEWGDLCRFRDGKHLASYTGLTSSEYSTGETVHRGRITKQGRPPVRGWLIESAWRSYNKDPVLLDKYLSVVHNSGSAKKAIVAVARKLVVRMWSLEHNHQTYQVGVIE
jgi:transposase